MKEVMDKILSVRKSAANYGVKASTHESHITTFLKKTATVESETEVPARVFSSKIYVESGIHCRRRYLFE